MKARAERQQETRQRIVEATAELHEEVGPANTTVAEIARRAGVQRLTVYNHFPQEGELFEACQAHFMAARRPLDFSAALALSDPCERVRSALRELYASYRATERMTAKVMRDRSVLPALDALMERTVDARLGLLGAELARGFRRRGAAARRVRAALALALAFGTWSRLKEAGLGDRAAADLWADMIAAAAGPD